MSEAETLQRPTPDLITEVPASILNPASAQPPKERFYYPEDLVAQEQPDDAQVDNALFSLQPGSTEINEHRIPAWRIKQVRAQMPEAVEGGTPFEFIAGGNHFELLGTQNVAPNRPAYVFRSQDTHGDVRDFFVYRSGSEGGMRVSQAITEPGSKGGNKRFIKGPESSENAQYSQDTQLHPAIISKINELYGKLGESKIAIGRQKPTEFIKPDNDIDRLTADFEAQIRVQGMGSDEVDKDLQELPKTGMLDEVRDWQEVAIRIDKLGRDMEKAGLVPEFTKPDSVGHETHPVLGEITREIYDVVVNGRPVEWHMAYDSEGRVWIDRIRFGDTEMTAYGTDKDIIYSGLLTSKPIDYDEQTKGLPDSLRIKNVNGSGYTDVTRFLNNFEPIGKFRAQRFAADNNQRT